MVATNPRKRTKTTKRMLTKLTNTVSTQKTVMKGYRETLTSKCSLTRGLPACPSLNLIACPSISHRVRKMMKKRRSKGKPEIMAMTIMRTLLKTSNRGSRCLRLTTVNHYSTSKNSTRSTKLHNKLLTMSAQW